MRVSNPRREHTVRLSCSSSKRAREGRGCAAASLRAVDKFRFREGHCFFRGERNRLQQRGMPTPPKPEIKETQDAREKERVHTEVLGATDVL